MTIERHVFPVSVAVKSPFIFADVDASGIGIDTPALRNHAKQPLLPADHFKGLLRQAFAALNAKSSLAFTTIELFGPPKDKMLPYTPVRGALHFCDLVCKAELVRGDITRITIDDATGTVKDGMLQVVELAAPLGQTVVFEGNLIWHGTSKVADDLRAALQKALRIIPYFGGLRSVGFGQHVRSMSTIGAAKTVALDIACEAKPGKRYVVTACFDRPIAVNVTQLAGNIFQGSSVVPGSAIKGSLAEMLSAGGVAATPDVKQALASLRIGHGYPVTAEEQLIDRALPLSWCWFNKLGKHANQLGRPDGELQGFDATHCEVGDFLPDMKRDKRISLATTVGREASDFDAWSLGHTEISDSTGAAQDSQLFVVIAMDTREHPYSFCIDVPDGNQDCAPILSRLKGGLDRIGKTEARMKVLSVREVRIKDDNYPQSPFNLLLETPALFIIPRDGDDAVPSDERLQMYFKHYGLELNDHFCQRKLVGGFPVLRQKGLSSYRPFALFEAGSCFSLSGEKEVIKAFMDHSKFGLPVLRETSDGVFVEETDWQRCLYLPQNGYGEISVNPSCLEATS